YKLLEGTSTAQANAVATVASEAATQVTLYNDLEAEATAQAPELATANAQAITQVGLYKELEAETTAQAAELAAANAQATIRVGLYKELEAEVTAQANALATSEASIPVRVQATLTALAPTPLPDPVIGSAIPELVWVNVYRTASESSGAIFSVNANANLKFKFICRNSNSSWLFIAFPLFDIGGWIPINAVTIEQNKVENLPIFEDTECQRIRNASR
ncbi:MAG: hypothetical protein KDI79_30060, partial [Anaerolineae bacterium]|nr:hypothetical protein [Anaerolineae bacterium]